MLLRAVEGYGQEHRSNALKEKLVERVTQDLTVCLMTHMIVLLRLHFVFYIIIINIGDLCLNLIRHFAFLLMLF